MEGTLGMKDAMLDANVVHLALCRLDDCIKRECASAIRYSPTRMTGEGNRGHSKVKGVST